MVTLSGGQATDTLHCVLHQRAAHCRRRDRRLRPRGRTRGIPVGVADPDPRERARAVRRSPCRIGRAGSHQGTSGLGGVPTRELLDGLVVLIGGVMICVPGFIGDAVGLLLMIGPVRHLVIRAFGHHLARRVQKMPPGRWGFIDARSTPARNGRAARNNIPLPPGTPDRPVRAGRPRRRLRFSRRSQLWPAEARTRSGLRAHRGRSSAWPGERSGVRRNPRFLLPRPSW
jgi:UPF0716 family protein affecting phage T7 exclusion